MKYLIGCCLLLISLIPVAAQTAQSSADCAAAQAQITRLAAGTDKRAERVDQELRDHKQIDLS